MVTVLLMSLQRSPQLLILAKGIARELRKKQTPTERILWDILRNRQFNGTKFLRQHPILVDDDGRETFFLADFYCAEKRLVVEIDGPIHRFQKVSDIERTQVLIRNGFVVLRLTSREVEDNVNDALNKIRKLL